jgi:hypothetical protein
MKTRFVAVVVALLGGVPQLGFAADREFESRLIVIRNKYATILAALFPPKPPARKVAVVELKNWSNTIASFSETAPLAEKGYAALVVHARDAEGTGTLESILLDVAAGVQEMKDRGYEKIVLMVGSGTTATIAYYQNVAENGNAAFAGEKKIVKFPGFFEKDGTTPLRLPRADGLIYRAPIDGISTSLFVRLDPSIVDEKTLQRDPSLDMFNPQNGYDPKTRTASYSEEFIDRYGKAQAARMNRLIDTALQCQADAKAGKGQFKDDGFIIYGSTRARLIYADMRMGNAVGKYLVLPENVVEAAKHDRLPDGGPEGWNTTGGAVVETCRSFLSFRAVRAEFFNPSATRIEDWGVDVDSSNNTVAGNMKHVTAPVVILYGTADDKMPGVEMIYNASKSKDKKVILLRGATHHLESVDPKRFLSSDAIRALFENQMAKWLDERFGIPSSQ